MFFAILTALLAIVFTSCVSLTLLICQLDKFTTSEENIRAKGPYMPLPTARWFSRRRMCKTGNLSTLIEYAPAGVAA